MQGFQGYGYSIEFNHNMYEIIHFLKSYPEYIIEITTECDEICKYCPYNKNNICKSIISNWLMKRMDKKVIKKLNIQPGSKIAVKDIFRLINSKFKTSKDTKGICSGCSWIGKCSWYLSNKKEL